MTAKQSRNFRTFASEDLVVDYSDSFGRVWKVGIEAKVVRGRLEIVRISVWDPKGQSPVTRRLLAELPIETLFSDKLKREETGKKSLGPRHSDAGPHSGQRYSDDELEAVAAVYLRAFESRAPVQRSVAEEFSISSSTAAKRIMAARKRGLIPAEVNERKSRND